MGLESRLHFLKRVAVLVGEVELPQLLNQLPSSHFSSAVGPAEKGDAPGMPYPHEGTHGLEPAASELGSRFAANGTGDAEDVQPVTNDHDCHYLG